MWIRVLVRYNCNVTDGEGIFKSGKVLHLSYFHHNIFGQWPHPQISFNVTRHFMSDVRYLLDVSRLGRRVRISNENFTDANPADPDDPDDLDDPDELDDYDDDDEKHDGQSGIKCGFCGIMFLALYFCIFLFHVHCLFSRCNNSREPPGGRFVLSPAEN